MWNVKEKTLRWLHFKSAGNLQTIAPQIYCTQFCFSVLYLNICIALLLLDFTIKRDILYILFSVVSERKKSPSKEKIEYLRTRM